MRLSSLCGVCGLALFFAAGGASAIGCGSDSTPLIGDGDPDSGNPADAGGAGRDAAASADGSPSPGDSSVAPEAGCVALASNPADVYVDHGAAAGGKGTAGCPFTSISRALALPPPSGGTLRVVHVAGSSAAELTYAEPSTLVIPQGVTVRDEGGTRDKTLITVASDAACIGTERCAVFVDGGAIEGFTVKSAPHDGIATRGSGTTIVPVLRRMKVTASGGDGIFSQGPGKLEAVDSTLNTAGHGLVASGIQSGAPPVLAPFIIGPDASATPTPSHFDGNGHDGVLVTFGVLLTMTGGSASTNGGNGVNLQGSTGAGAAASHHTLTGVTTNGNGAGPGGSGAFSGIEVHFEVSAKLRGCTAVGNGSNGVTFFTNQANMLDLGTAAAGDSGCNTFAGGVANNAHAGVCVQNGGGGAIPDGTVSAVGNAWTASCASEGAISSSSASSGCYAAASYSDVTYWWPAAPAGKSPVNTGGSCAKPGGC